MEQALRAADAAGDTAAATQIAMAMRAVPVATTSTVETPRIRTNPVSAALNEFSQQFTGGFSDELAAGMGAGVVAPFSDKSFGDLYGTNVATERANLAAGRSQYPVSDIIGGAAGLLNPKSAATQIVNLGRRLPAAARNLPTWMRSAGAGAAAGGVYGAGASEGGVTDRAGDAALNATIGAVASPIVSTLAKPILTGGRNLLGMLARKLSESPRREAERLVGDAARNDMLSPADIARLGANPNLTVADLGENVAGLARGAAAKPGPFRTAATNFLRGRQEGQQGRLVRSLGIRGPQDFKDSFDDWAASRITAASQKYDEAYQASFDASSPQYQALLRKPAMQKALEEAERKIANESGIKGGNVQRLDFAKRALDDMIGTARRGGAMDEARILGNIKRELVTELDRQVPAYAQARSIFAGESAVREAAETGADLFSRSTSHDVARRAVADMSPSEFEAFRRGAFRNLVDMLETTPENRNAAQKLIESQAVRDKVRLMFQNEDDFAQFVKTAIDESRMSYTRNFVTGGSPTARIQEEGRAIRESGQFVQDAMSGNHLGMVARALRAFGIGEKSPETMEELGKILFSNPSPQMLARIGRASNTPPPGPISQRTQILAGALTGAVPGALVSGQSEAERRMMAERLQGNQ